MSIISEGKKVRKQASTEAWQKVEAIWKALEAVRSSSLNEEGEALVELMKYAAKNSDGDGFTAAQLAKMSDGDFTTMEIAGNLTTLLTHHVSRYEKIRPYRNPVTVSKKVITKRRIYAELNEAGDVIPGTQFVREQNQSRYFFHKK